MDVSFIGSTCRWVPSMMVSGGPIIRGSTCRWVPSDLRGIYQTMMVSGGPIIGVSFMPIDQGGTQSQAAVKHSL